MARPLPDKALAHQFVEDYAAGGTLKSISQRYGVAPATVRRTVLTHGGVIREYRKSLPVDAVAAVVAAYESGASYLSLAKQYLVSRSVMKRILLEEGASLRSPSETSRQCMSRLNAEQRRLQTEAANEAARGRKASHEELCKKASTRERRRSNIGKDEPILQAMLEERGIRCVAQKAIGPYNCDLASEPVAVEVFSGNFHFSGRHWERLPKRLHYLMNHGWSVVMVLVGSKAPLTPAGADKVVSLIQEARRHEPSWSGYRMILGTGEFVAAGSSEDDERAIIMTLRRGRNAAT